MPTKEEHINKAEHNEKFANTLFNPNSEYFDWLTTALFYSSLHYIDAYLATKGIHPSSHANTDEDVGRDSHVYKHFKRPLYKDYSYLKSQSINARYDTITFTYNNIISDIKPTHDAIKSKITPLL